MKKICLSVFFLIVMYGCSNLSLLTSSELPNSDLPSNVTLIEKVEPSADKVMIPYSKYRLDNGLTVILSPDHSDPLVHVDVTYHVGSAREEVGKSGFAHFFEHMMFQGSEHVGDQQHFKIITEAGGTLNGSTNRDRTNYFETVPANQLEKMLWLESDRMGFLIDAVSQRKFEIQRDTVKNERAQNYDNRPYGLIWEKMGEALYPEGHPYSWQTIGYVSDLDRVDVNDLKAFFLRWYGPNNAVLTIGGDIDVNQTLAWVSQYFGSIPAGPKVENAPKQPVTLAQDRYITLQDRIRQPMVLIGWPTVYEGEEHQVALDVLANVLGGGKNSLLYQKLVKTQKAVDAGAFQDCAELSCTFYIYAMGNSADKDGLQPLYQEIVQILDEFKAQGVDPQRLEEITATEEAAAVFALQSVSGKVSMLASNQVFTDKPDQLETDLARLRAVNEDSVMAVYKQFIDNKHKVTLSVVPKKQLKLAVKKADFVTPTRALPSYDKITDEQLHYQKAVDNFDRAVMPQAAGAVKAQLSALYRFHYSNGSELLGSQTSETPTVQISIQLPAGDRYVASGKEGLASLTATLLEEGTLKNSAEAIQAKLDKLGSNISVTSGAYVTEISIASLTKNLPETMAIVEEMLFEPAFNQDDFERLRNQMLENMIYQHQTSEWMAAQATREILFKNTLFARSSDGTKASLASLTLQDVKDFYRDHYTPQGMQIVVVGDVSKTEIDKQLGFLKNWRGEKAPELSPQTITMPVGQKIYLVNKTDAPQSTIRFVRNGLPFDATGEFYRAQLSNFNLAGNFNSRINQNLREDKGYTYGASGYFSGNREVGSVIFNTQVRANVTAEAVSEILKDLNNYSQNGISESELSFMKLAVGQQDALKYETPAQKAQLLANILTYSLDDDYLEQRNKILTEMDKTTLNQLAKKWFQSDRYQIIVVGDAKSLKPQLEKLKIPVQQLEITH